MVRPTTSGSERFFAFFFKPLVGMKQMIHRWKDIVEAHLFHIYYFFSNSLRFKSSFKFSKSRNSVFSIIVFYNFRTVFAPVFELFVETRRVICRWKATNEAQLCHAEHFSRFLAV